ncbi:helix-turn-helix domain-containing protein [Paraburkholderia sp. SARCC-3016]|uniref:helix-turn-helix domain-containing protein n=1 Tax=Paraburkholderia sp. SARCC-3016 TaxID=3058611 RepID=UPI002809CE97|nr:helix-turn-helix domain-containing protein [Paraburkholderia sp. SARCC-3016]MDQ7981361.1 helix-turn-helix domain-containing protein [Paraburkholderia sp. SARCC-3016]
MPTQAVIAEHLGISQQAVSNQLNRLEIDWRSASLDEIRLAYIEHLRGLAAGNRSENGIDLVAERAMTERITRELKLLELAEKRNQLVNATQLEVAYGQMVDSFRAELLSLPEKIVDDIRTLHGIDVDVELVNEYVINALAELSGHDAGGGRADRAPARPADTTAAGGNDGLGEALSSSFSEELGQGGPL